MSVIVSAAIEESGRAARVTWADGTSGHFHAVWLRDNCQDERCRHPGNGQRLFDILDLPADLRLARAEPTADGEGLEVVFAPEDHATRFRGRLATGAPVRGGRAQGPGLAAGRGRALGPGAGRHAAEPDFRGDQPRRARARTLARLGGALRLRRHEGGAA